jgi:MFS family permease
MLVGLIAGTKITRVLSRRVQTVTALVAGFGILFAGLALGAMTYVGSPPWWLLCWTSIHGVGLGMTMPTTLALAVSALPAGQAGMGSALLQAVRQSGGAIGVAVLGAVFNTVYHARLQRTVGAFVSAMDSMLVCGAAAAALAIVACLRFRIRTDDGDSAQAVKS